MGQATNFWTTLPIARIEDLRDAAYGADFEVTQMSTALLSGGLAFSLEKGIVYSSSLINGQVALSGPVSRDSITLGIGLRLGAGTRHWLNETMSGVVGVFHPCDDHDAFYTPGALFATAALTVERLEEEAASEEIVLDRKVLGGTGIHPEIVSPTVVRKLRQRFERLHAGVSTNDAGLGQTVLRILINHIGRAPGVNRRRSKNGHARIVTSAREYIQAHLAEPISLDNIACAANASRRTLHRAFEEILDDTPHTYVRRLRLHRIRHDLASDVEKACTIALVANNWGISELGRMSKWYRELFGEMPSETIGSEYRSPQIGIR